MDFFDKIQEYLEGNLSLKEQQTFEAELQKNENLAATVEHFPVIDKVLDYLIQEKVRKQLDLFPKPQQTYTLSELLEMFGVSEVYEDMVEATLRGTESLRGLLLEVLKPENKAVYQNGLTFKLEMRLPFELSLSILHHKDKIVFEQQIAKNTLKFTFQIPNLKPGRYYWRLAPSDTEIDAQDKHEAVYRIFFVRKDLEPDVLKNS